MGTGQVAGAEQWVVRGGLAVPARMAEVQRRHFAGQSTGQIAAALAVAEGTVRADLRRLAQRWQAQTDADAATLRAALVAQLNDLKHRAIAAAECDQRAEQEHTDDAGLQESSVTALRGSRQAPSRSQRTQALNVARQCVMDQARLLGLFVDKSERSAPAPVPVRIYELEIDGQSEVG